MDTLFKKRPIDVRAVKQYIIDHPDFHINSKLESDQTPFALAYAADEIDLCVWLVNRGAQANTEYFVNDAMVYERSSIALIVNIFHTRPLDLLDAILNQETVDLDVRKHGMDLQPLEILLNSFQLNSIPMRNTDDYIRTNLDRITNIIIKTIRHSQSHFRPDTRCSCTVMANLLSRYRFFFNPMILQALAAAGYEIMDCDFDRTYVWNTYRHEKWWTDPTTLFCLKLLNANLKQITYHYDFTIRRLREEPYLQEVIRNRPKRVDFIHKFTDTLFGSTPSVYVLLHLKKMYDIYNIPYSQEMIGRLYYVSNLIYRMYENHIKAKYHPQSQFMQREFQVTAAADPPTSMIKK